MALDWTRDGAHWPNRGLSRFLETRGARWHLQRGGAGPRVLLLHGAGAATHTWRGLVPLLTGRVEILAPDLPGQGFSTGKPQRYTLPGMAEDLAALLAAEDFAPDLELGHSAGAAIALRMAIDGSVAPRRILALNGALTPFRGVAGMLFPQLARLLALSPLSGQLLARTATAPGAVRSLIGGTGSRIDREGLRLYAQLITAPAHVRATLEMMARWDLAPLIADLPRLAVPVTLALGLRDRAVPPEEARRLLPALRHGEVVEFPGLGHLVHEEAPDKIAALIARLLAPETTAARLRCAAPSGGGGNGI